MALEENRPRPPSLPAHWDVAVASDKDELFFTVALNQFFLQIHPVDSRHLHIHDHARRAAVWWTGQEIGSRRENFAFVPSSPKESRHSFSRPSISLNQDNKDF